VFLLIDTRPPPAPDGRDPVEPNWRIVGWALVCLGLLVLAVRDTGSGAGVVLVLLALFAALKAFDAFLGGDGRGLRDWRQ
jgi:hypothetical protein